MTKDQAQAQAELTTYADEVYKVLDSFHYHEDMVPFIVDQDTLVTKVGLTIIASFTAGMSARWTAVVVWSYTMNYYILPMWEGERSH